MLLEYTICSLQIICMFYFNSVIYILVELYCILLYLSQIDVSNPVPFLRA